MDHKSWHQPETLFSFCLRLKQLKLIFRNFFLQNNLLRCFSRRLIKPFYSGNGDIHLLLLGASTLSRKTLGITTLGITQRKFNCQHNKIQHKSTLNYDLSLCCVILLSVIMLNVTMLCVIMLGGTMLCVDYEFRGATGTCSVHYTVLQC
jgi:hypothetical protein